MQGIVVRVHEPRGIARDRERLTLHVDGLDDDPRRRGAHFGPQTPEAELAEHEVIGGHADRDHRARVGVVLVCRVRLEQPQALHVQNCRVVVVGCPRQTQFAGEIRAVDNDLPAAVKATRVQPDVRKQLAEHRQSVHLQGGGVIKLLPVGVRSVAGQRDPVVDAHEVDSP